MKALIITWEKFQDHEVIYPFYRLKEEEFDVKIMSNVLGRFHGIMGTNMDSDFTVESLKDMDTIALKMTFKMPALSTSTPLP